ncbi:Hypothetical protein FKW44_007337 [Caligus rogercresseyi]|uniref:Uncharacterized protein n=1 Tax=Caligus rogercresseyi TaxID=217165 RepID=A0A7T8KEL1_CALRO|nr:Hypothetical protein FKW44_007337 [Caligus rogercresseyi]
MVPAVSRTVNGSGTSSSVPSRRKLSKDLKVMGSKAKSELTHLLSQQNYVATTGKIYFFT